MFLSSVAGLGILAKPGSCPRLGLRCGARFDCGQAIGAQPLMQIKARRRYQTH